MTATDLTKRLGKLVKRSVLLVATVIAVITIYACLHLLPGGLIGVLLLGAIVFGAWFEELRPQQCAAMRHRLGEFVGDVLTALFKNVLLPVFVLGS